jgi:putative ABC transport system permease protein
MESVTSSFVNVLGNKMRSVLTMLGIVIGIGAVIMITSIGDGVKAQTQSQLSDLGMDSIAVTVKNTVDTRQSDLLTLSDMEVVAVPDNVKCVVPIFTASGQSDLRVPGEKKNVVVIGATSDFQQVQPLTLLEGRSLTQTDVDNRTGVAIIESDFAVKLFGRTDVMGEEFSVSLYAGKKTFTIVGISKPANFSEFFEQPTQIFVPITTAMDYYGTNRIDSLYFLVHDQSKAEKTIAQVNMLLSNKHNNEDMYQFQNWRDTADQLNDVLNQVTMFVALVASIALIVGGIGIMNIMLVTVTERTREIGIRKSLGATNGNILFQFLAEAMILTVIGGIIGIAFGYAGSFLISLAVNITPEMSPLIIAGTVAVSSVIGIVFGVYPANKAAALDPIEALRYE